MQVAGLLMIGTKKYLLICMHTTIFNTMDEQLPYHSVTEYVPDEASDQI